MPSKESWRAVESGVGTEPGEAERTAAAWVDSSGADSGWRLVAKKVEMTAAQMAAEEQCNGMVKTRGRAQAATNFNMKNDGDRNRACSKILFNTKRRTCTEGCTEGRVAGQAVGCAVGCFDGLGDGRLFGAADGLLWG